MDVGPHAGKLDVAGLEAAAVEPARGAHGKKVAGVVQAISGKLFGGSIGPRWSPLADDVQREVGEDAESARAEAESAHAGGFCDDDRVHADGEVGDAGDAQALGLEAAGVEQVGDVDG